MIIGSKIFHKKRIYNSLLWAKEEIDSAQEGSVFLADIHEYTHGRQNRKWIFDKDQLAVTILLKPKKNLGFLNQLSMAVSLGILYPLKEFGIVFKWANDFYYKEKKVGGLLSQTVWSGDKLKGIIFGFAINVNNTIPKLNHPWYRVESLKNIVGKRINKELLLERILKSIDSFYKKWLKDDSNKIFSLWKQNQAYLNKTVTVHKADKTLLTGLFKDVLPNGGMVLKTNEGEEIIIPFYTVNEVEIKNKN